MSEDAGGAGAFELGSAYVRVDPDAEAFPGQLEEQLGGIDYVVTIPVRADTAGLQESVDAAAAEAQATVVVPVTADPAGLKESVDAASASSGAVVTVPLEADPADLAPQADAAATAAGETAGTSFADKFSSVAGQMSLFTPDQGEADSAAAAAGAEAGASFGENFTRVGSGFPLFVPGNVEAEAAAAGEEAGKGFAASFDSAAAAVTAPLAALGPEAAAEGAAAGEEAGAGFVSRLGAMLSGVTSMFTGLIPAAATEGAAAGEAAGEGFASRFASMMSGVTSAFSGLIPGMEAEGAAGGAAAGEGFISRLKSAVMGGISPMEALMGAGFVAATAVMASHFDAAMERIHTQAGVGQSAISGLSGGVLDLAGKVGEGPSSLADALYHVESSFASVGISGQKAMSLLQTAAEGARVGNSNLVDTTNALDATIASGIGGINSYSQAMGALNAIVGAGDMSMQDLSDAMGSGLMAVAKSYGQSINDIGAALATFGDNNIRGAKAATDLRMAMQAILAPVKTGESYLQHLGLTMTSLGDTMTHHGLTAAIAEFVQHLEAAKVPVSDWGEYVTDIFGKKAGAGIGVLVDQLGRLQSKMPDLKRGAEQFGNAWASTQATAAQKVHELEAGFQALMVRIGNGLLPTITSLLDLINRNLPVIERLGTKIAHLVAPAVTGFFKGLESIFKELFGPLRSVTEAFAAGLVVFLGAVKLVGVFEAIGKAWKALSLLLESNPWILIATAIATLAVLIVRYHQQIWDAIKGTWDKVTHFFAGIIDPIVKPVEKAFDEIKSAITGGFDSWWKSHGKEIEEVWHVAWTAISDYFKITWDVITGYLKFSWDAIMAIFKPALDLIETSWKTSWDAITAIFKTAWDLIAATVKIIISGIELLIKTSWDTVVGIFNVFLDLITGHWSKAWTDLKNMATQVWNAIKGFLGSVWHDIATVVEQVVNNLIGFFTHAWNDVKSGVTSAFNDVRHTIASIWDGILHDIENVVNKIKSLISSIVSAPGNLISGALGAIGLAGGGVLPGYAPGHDTVKAVLSPGEAVIVPEAVKAIGADRINAINAHYSGGRSRGGDGAYAGGGIVSHYATGGIAEAGLPAYADGGFPGSGGGFFPASGQQPGTTAPGGGNVFNVNFYGTQYPTPEMEHAIFTKLAVMVGNAG